MTYDQFLSQYPVKMEAESANSNPNMANSANMDHWNVRLTFQGRTMNLVFSQGQAFKGSRPELASMLDCLASDTALVVDDFESWASDLGFDPDSRQAEKTYNAVRQQSLDFQALLGDAMETLLNDVERL